MRRVARVPSSRASPSTLGLRDTQPRRERLCVLPTLTTTQSSTAPWTKTPGSATSPSCACPSRTPHARLWASCNSSTSSTTFPSPAMTRTSWRPLQSSVAWGYIILTCK
ncbi:hypothetical protein GWK47_042908 [Chionoecetes opilio]|uniref:Uncharacterized protein n=1 Tax=Chionoecetes opilio TaxID=41210 RepID=A0A8J4Y8Q7_CHIOP|nr:hypothetical protein GWK47_042908 [Chionoecetes opilio]